MRSICAILAVAIVCAAGQAGADEDKPPVKLTLHPAAEPRPALKYQLLPEFMERIPGNAAVYYGKVTSEPRQLFTDQEMLDKIECWRKAPLEQLRKDDVRLPLGSIDYYLNRAARCEYCDWQLPIHEESPFTILLPELQQLRHLGRLLATKARIHIARGEFDEALKTLQTGYALGQDAAEGETLINGLVGIAICGMMSDQVMEFVQQPDAPNLYWALSMLPRPLIDVRDAIETEMHIVELSFPELRNLEDTKGSPEAWSERWHEFCRKMADLSGDPKMRTNFARAMVMAASIRGYPMAKRALVERGASAEAVEAMPVSQVILLYTMQTYEELRDDIFKWFYTSYPEAREPMDAAEAGLKRAVIEKREIVPVAGSVLPAIQGCRISIVRSDRKIAVLRIVEALRLYATDHDGRLPEKLSDVTSVPIPDDPVTGKPFEYRVEGDIAHLLGPSVRGDALWNYEITMVRK